MTEKFFRGKRKDTMAKRKRILEELVPRLPVPREERRAPNTLPDVRGRNTQTRNGTDVPIQGRGDAVQTVQKTTGLGSSKGRNRGIRSHKMQKRSVRGSRAGKRERVRTDEMDELGNKRGRVFANIVKSVTEPTRSFPAKTNASGSVRDKRRIGTGRIVNEQEHQRNTK
jgi:hypothetical protein